MADERGTLTSVSFVYEYEGHGWARAGIFKGVFEGFEGDSAYFMNPSYAAPTDPLYSLVQALTELLVYGGSRTCDWFYEPGIDRWVFEREGDALTITIRSERGGQRFMATCILWEFAAQVRLAVEQMEPPEPTDHWDPTLVKYSTWFRDLCAHLDDRS